MEEKMYYTYILASRSHNLYVGITSGIEVSDQHYGHVNTIKHADRVLQGMTGWELPHLDDTKAKASKAAETHHKLKRG